MSDARSSLVKALLRFHPVAWVWVVAVAALWITVAVIGAEPTREAARRVAALAEGPWLPVALLAAYALRTVLLLPTTALALVAGWAAGPLWGAALAWLGALLSASLAYALARWAHRDEEPLPDVPKVLGGWRGRLQRHTFEAVLLARLAAAPGDVVNLVAGASRAPFLPFAAATALGGLPGMLAAVWAGASIEGAFVLRSASIEPGLILASLAMAAVGLASAWWVRRRTGGAVGAE